MTKKILVIKLGYSETLDREQSLIPSLGDVVRTTPILWALKEKFPDSVITWLVAPEARPFLQGVPMIDRILEWNSFVPFQLMRERFDVLINLEKIPGVCGLVDMIDAWVKYGFRFDATTGDFGGYEQGESFIEYIRQKELEPSKPRKYWQQTLIEMLGVPWRQQEYVMAMADRPEPRWDVGLNYRVGAKWPDKTMPDDHWKQLADLLASRGMSVSWQEGFADPASYIRWISSNRSIVTADSLGLHLAIGLRIPFVGLFGPTDSREVFTYGRGRSILPRLNCPHLPCYANTCLIQDPCMAHIPLMEVVRNVEEILPARSMMLNEQPLACRIDRVSVDNTTADLVRSDRRVDAQIPEAVES
jgi:heptosyltransferase II